MSTPKNKAKEIYDEFYHRIVGIDNFYSKRACEVAIFYIIETLIEYGKDTHELQNMDREIAFWNEVIEEINLI